MAGKGMIPRRFLKEKNMKGSAVSAVRHTRLRQPYSAWRLSISISAAGKPATEGVFGVTVSIVMSRPPRDRAGMEKYRPRQYGINPCASRIGQVATAGVMLK